MQMAKEAEAKKLEEDKSAEAEASEKAAKEKAEQAAKEEAEKAAKEEAEKAEKAAKEEAEKAAKSKEDEEAEKKRLEEEEMERMIAEMEAKEKEEEERERQFAAKKAAELEAKKAHEAEEKAREDERLRQLEREAEEREAKRAAGNQDEESLALFASLKKNTQFGHRQRSFDSSRRGCCRTCSGRISAKGCKHCQTSACQSQTRDYQEHRARSTLCCHAESEVCPFPPDPRRSHQLSGWYQISQSCLEHGFQEGSSIRQGISPAVPRCFQGEAIDRLGSEAKGDCWRLF
jgi:hypothetical protein